MSIPNSLANAASSDQANCLMRLFLTPKTGSRATLLLSFEYSAVVSRTHFGC
jgi:hypothetical protein